MVQAADLSARLGLISPQDAGRLRQLIERAGLPVAAPAFDPDTWLELMAIDKKADAGTIRFVLLERLGAVRVTPAPDEALRATLAATATVALSTFTAAAP
jgi:3-dehydroquinate synthase